MATLGTGQLNAEQTSIFSAPHAFVDKRGDAVLIKPLNEKRHDQLTRLYLDYEPRDSFSGLPPILDDECVRWVHGMIRDGVNLIAISFEKGIIGHAVIFPMDEKRCEMLIAIAPGYQNVGIGTQLTRCIIQLAFELEFERIWLAVEITNQIARHVYQKCGFEYISHNEVHELDMVLELRHYRQMTGITVSGVMNRQLIVAHKNLTCEAAIDLFLKNHIASLPVVDDNNELIGIVTETDMLMVGSSRQKVMDVLTRQVITVGRDCPLSKIMRLFQSRKVRCIPVVDDNMKLLGIVGRKEVLACYSSNGKPDDLSGYRRPETR